MPNKFTSGSRRFDKGIALSDQWKGIKYPTMEHRKAETLKILVNRLSEESTWGNQWMTIVYSMVNAKMLKNTTGLSSQMCRVFDVTNVRYSTKNQVLDR